MKSRIRWLWLDGQRACSALSLRTQEVQEMGCEEPCSCGLNIVSLERRMKCPSEP